MGHLSRLSSSSWPRALERIHAAAFVKTSVSRKQHLLSSITGNTRKGVSRRTPSRKNRSAYIRECICPTGNRSQLQSVNSKVDICPYVDASAYDRSTRYVDLAIFLRYWDESKICGYVYVDLSMCRCFDVWCICVDMSIYLWKVA